MMFVAYARYPHQDLPRPQRAGYARGQQDQRLLSQPESGPIRSRRRSSSAMSEVRLQIVVSREGRARFDRFFHEEIEDGAAQFIMEAPDTDGWPLKNEDGVHLLDENDEPLLMTEEWLCLLGREMPQTTPVGVEWRIDFSVLVLP
jgi:hypothetical protein